MQKNRMWMYVLPSVFLVLLLCALVETPQDSAIALPEKGFITGATLLPCVPPAPDNATHYTLRTEAFGRETALPAQPFAALDNAIPIADANGRIVCYGSYVRCVYQVFRQEAACG